MIRAVLRWTALAVSAILFVAPFYLLLRNGLASRAEITAPGWTLWPKQVHWENFSKLFDQQDVPFARSIVNSVVVAVLQTVGLLVVCSLAGYGLARVPYRYSKPVFYAVLATLMIPTSVTFVPSFVVVSTLGWLSDFRGLIIPGLFSAFSVFLFRQYFLDFPKELEDAGRVDGLSRWGVFRKIVVPNSRGFFAAIAVITVIGSWNAFLWPLIIAQSPDSWTVQVALSGLLTAQNPQLNLLFLAAVLSLVPIVLLFAFLQRYLVRGVTESGLKG